jgi:hypothetical protein
MTCALPWVAPMSTLPRVLTQVALEKLVTSSPTVLIGK